GRDLVVAAHVEKLVVAGLAVSAGKCRVQGLHGGGEEDGVRIADLGPLVGRVEVLAVLDQPTAETSAELVAIEGGLAGALLLLHLLLKLVVAIQHAIAPVLEQLAVILVGAALG